MSGLVRRFVLSECFYSSSSCFSNYCTAEFDAAYNYIAKTKRKKRLIALMMLDSPNEVLADDGSSHTETLRQYLRQYTYIDYTADDWFDRLLYAMPLRGLLRRNEDAAPVDVDDDDDRLLQPAA